MIRGTFANIRLRNEMTSEVEGSSTVHYPSGERLSIPDAAERYRASGVALVIVAGREYGAGSSRDWAAKGTRLLGVGAVIAGSFERIHRSNLVGMGVLPLEFTGGDTRKSLAIDGSETFDILGLAGDLKPRQEVRAMMHKNGKAQELVLRLRLDTQLDLSYFRHGGMLPCVLRRYLNREKNHDTTPMPA
jgi:aconitate hydratase